MNAPIRKENVAVTWFQQGCIPTVAFLNQSSIQSELGSQTLLKLRSQLHNLIWKQSHCPTEDTVSSKYPRPIITGLDVKLNCCDVYCLGPIRRCEAASPSKKKKKKTLFRRTFSKKTLQQRIKKNQKIICSIVRKFTQAPPLCNVLKLVLKIHVRRRPKKHKIHLTRYPNVTQLETIIPLWWTGTQMLNRVPDDDVINVSATNQDWNWKTGLGKKKKKRWV